MNSIYSTYNNIMLGYILGRPTQYYDLSININGVVDRQLNIHNSSNKFHFYSINNIFLSACLD